MSDYSDIINRLRQVPRWDPESQTDICKDAIAEIARLRSRAAEAHQWEEMAERTGLPLKPEGAEAEIARLREMESQAKAAGFIGPDGKVVRFEKQYWRADADGDPCDDLEVLAEACEDGVMLEVVPILILPREWHVVEVAADGTGTTRPPTPEETEARKKAEQEWRARARTLPTQPKTAREGNQ